MSVAYVDLGQSPFAIVRDKPSALQAVVDNGAALDAAVDRSGTKRHDRPRALRPCSVELARSPAGILIDGKGSEHGASTRLG